MRFKFSDPAGTIKKVRRATPEEWKNVVEGEVRYGGIVEEEWADIVPEDRDGDVTIMVTTKGKYYVVSQNYEGHGMLSIVEEVPGS